MDEQTPCPTCDRPLQVNQQCNNKGCVQIRNAKNKRPMLKSASSSRAGLIRRNGTPPAFTRVDKPRTDPPPNNE